MANNIVPGQNVIFAQVSIDIIMTGVNPSNTRRVYCIEPTTSLSYEPNRPFNQITQFIKGKKYLLIAIEPFDLSAYVSPPFPSGDVEWIKKEW